MPRYRFEEISVTGAKRWKDPATGKRRQETRKFMQTVNPFNRNEDGSIKTAEQIFDELCEQRKAWLKEPPTEGLE